MQNEDRAARPPWTVRVAGGLVLVVGVANLLVALVATSVSGLPMPPLVATGLVAAGAATAWLGWKVLRGATWALPVATAVFAALLLARVALVDDADQPIGVATGRGASEVLLVVLVVVLAVAMVHRRRVERPSAE